ncbi:uncharacterized protein B0H18DRAFT_1205741 [Fomitopsis serialis]|uniref:uncharacterized protein n=1 Tax=Fomitopsis serialis TaxID=139415 RepID=UPI002008CF64|nr:uncharacterized protein B0H18DRAFT_1205741 [Neoantrodia serialis]KAH9938522.1 hypothetical protein B0H18DRAFT_1205741 [Neoantrodia serialis]
MSAVNHELDLSERDLLGGVGNALSSIINPIFPGQQTTSDTSTSSTITLTSSATATQTDTSTQSAATSTATATSSSTTSTVASTQSSSSSSSPSARSSSSSATSSATTSSSAGTSSTSEPPSATTVVTTGADGTITLTSTSSPSSTASATPAANAATSSGFLANKGLSVGVITACSLVGLVLLIIVATYTCRRRRRNKLHEEAVDFTPFPSSDELISSHNDVERGGGGGLRTRPSSRGSATDESVPKASPQEMYQTGYHIMPAFLAFPSQTYANPVQGYSDFGTYPSYDTRAAPPANANGYQPVAAGVLAPRPGPTYNNGYGAPAGTAGVPAGAPVRKASQRKQVPPLNLSATRDNANPPAYQVTGNGASPMLANPYGTTPNAAAADPPLSAVSPRMKRGSTSLLNSPVGMAFSDESASAESERAPDKSRSRTSSHSRMLDPSLPQLPVLGSLPDEFGGQSGVAVRDEKAAVRQLTVRNE